ALNTVSEELNTLKVKYGAESVSFISGSYKGIRDAALARFANAFGSPNHLSAAYTCFISRVLASSVTYGKYVFPDYEQPPACLIIWGANTHNSRLGEFRQTLRALDRGTKLIAIDPADNEFTRRADLWLRPKPSTDLALALSLINVLINEELYDKDFVREWTVGFDKLRRHVEEYYPEKVEEITWIPASSIREAAHFYAANKPACIQWGNGLDTNLNSFQSARAISILRAITGNLGIHGGELQWALPSLQDLRQFKLDDIVSPFLWNKSIDAHNKPQPAIYEVIPQSIIKAMLHGDPYRIRAAYLQGCNALLSWPDAKETLEALQKLEFLAVSELFMTPTAALADIVLPAATYLEFDSICSPPYYPAHQVQQKVTEVGECWSDLKILNQLAEISGLKEYFWKNEEQALDEMLQPAGLTFRELKKSAIIKGSKLYESYRINGFETPSRKVELYSEQLKIWGYDPLPVFYEIPATIDEGTSPVKKEYPLILTNYKSSQFRHSGGRQIDSLRGSHPEPTAILNSITGKNLGIREGDWIYIETNRGKIKQKAVLNPNIDERVIVVDYGCWFPERDAPGLYGWADSNVNVLTSNKLPVNKELGSPNFRGITCRVQRV
ncbi:MAG TPA: hypothetical protein ENN61_02570, partial [Bacteroidaceae bacterium]|nr:hypothetical protein [Bacteroidaceae bacterium]